MPDMPQLAYTDLPSNLDELSTDEARAIWLGFSPFLESRKIYIFGTEKYNDAQLPPPNDPYNPFCVKEDENFVFYSPDIRLSFRRYKDYRSYV